MDNGGATDSGMRISYIGNLPVGAISRVIPLILPDSRVFLTEAARKHVRRKHPDAFLEYLSMLPDLVSHPTYAGRYEKKEFALQLVTPLALRGVYVLIAIDLHTVRNPSMRNTISSFYSLESPSFDVRIKSGRLRPIPY